MMADLQSDPQSDDPSSSCHNNDDIISLHGNLPMRIEAADLNQWLADRPLTRLMSRKYSSCQQRRWEYHICHCGCGYKINITHFVDADGDYCEVTDSGDIPLDHCDVDENPDNIAISKQVLNTVDKLLEHNKFAKNYGPKWLVGDL